MKYVSIPQPGQVQVLSREAPTRQKGEVRLRLLYGGLCGSDIGTYRGTFIYASYPRIPGHEMSACIEELDEEDAQKYGLKKGMVVTVNPYFNCGHCYSCERGFVNCCTSNETLGAQRDGIFCQYVTIPAERVYDGKGLPPKLLALVEPFCISHHAMSQVKVQAGEKVLVVGGGPIGLLAMLSAKLQGAEVTVADVMGGKLETAKKLGAAYVVDSSKEDLAQRTAEITGGNGFEICVEAAGQPEALISCVENAAFHGRVAVVGVSKRNVDLMYSLMQKKELTMVGSRNALKADFESLIQLLAEHREYADAVMSLVTTELPYTEAEEAFRQAVDPARNNIKTMLRFE